jgi:hypothetical protein
MTKAISVSQTLRGTENSSDIPELHVIRGQSYYNRSNMTGKYNGVKH